MIIMALDHVRDFVHRGPSSSSQPGWVRSSGISAAAPGAS
jgi:hypothetical protein